MSPTALSLTVVVPLAGSGVGSRLGSGDGSRLGPGPVGPGVSRPPSLEISEQDTGRVISNISTNMIPALNPFFILHPPMLTGLYLHKRPILACILSKLKIDISLLSCY